MPLQDVFAGVKEAKPSFAANYTRDGHYFARINRVKFGKSRKSEEFVAVEMIILHVYDDNNGTGHKVGEDATHMLMCKHDMFLPNFKAMVVNLVKCPETEIGPEECMQICDENIQPFAGMLVEFIAKTITTQADRDFTRMDYKRQVPAEEVAGLLSDDLKERLFPQGELERKIEVERKSPVPQ